MDGIFTVHGICVEIIEILGEFLLVQEIVSKIIRLIICTEIDSIIQEQDIFLEKSNVISMFQSRQDRKNGKTDKRRDSKIKKTSIRGAAISTFKT
jgi:hypothetical protein